MSEIDQQQVEENNPFDIHRNLIDDCLRMGVMASFADFEDMAWYDFHFLSI